VDEVNRAPDEGEASRRYESVVRREQAARTRQRILDAAEELFLAQGFARTSVRAIAERAEVAKDTVYATFGAKVRVLTALIDRRLAPSGTAVNLLDEPGALAVRDEVSPRRQARAFAEFVAAVGGRVFPIHEVLRAAATADPAVAAIHAEMEGYRLANMRRVAGWFAARGPLRVEVDRAGEVLWLLASPNVGAMLRDGRGWSEDDYAAWLEDTIVRTLLADPG
jgi:AcrR family transcriptional regulator